MPRREPNALVNADDWASADVPGVLWMKQCLTDMRDGKHARWCGCDRKIVAWVPDYTHDANGGEFEYDGKANACTEIVRCALEMEGYDAD